MKHCQDCGTQTQPLNTGGGGCGGLGRMVRCPNSDCDQVWEQTTGGILATAGGEQWSRVTKFITYQGQLARNVRPHKLQDGHWGFWDELYNKHGPYFSEESAKEAIKIRAKALDKEQCYCCRKISLAEHICSVCKRCPHCKCIPDFCPETKKQTDLFGENNDT